MNELIERYLQTWNETDPPARRRLIDGLWAEDARYTDPMADAHGRDEIDAVIGAVQAQFPGLRFTLAGPVDAHHRQARFTWALGTGGSADTDPLVVGFDVATVDPAGRISSVLGFLDKVPG